MSEIQKMIVGETTERIIRTLFDQRIQQESTEPDYNTSSRASRIKDLKIKVISYIKRNPNAQFELVTPEYKADKQLVLVFSNYELANLNDKDVSKFTITISDNFVEAEVRQKVIVGKDMIMKLKAE